VSGSGIEAFVGGHVQAVNRSRWRSFYHRSAATPVDNQLSSHRRRPMCVRRSHPVLWHEGCSLPVSHQQPPGASDRFESRDRIDRGRGAGTRQRADAPDRNPQKRLRAGLP
jgi:hypothetical protein